MPSLIFRAAYIRFVDLRYDEKSKTVYTKLNLTAGWTDKIMEEMEWPEPPERYGAADLVGELAATKIEFIPNGDLKQHGFELEAKTIDTFSVHPIKDKETGEVTEHELRFVITTTALKAAQKLGAYLATIGKGEAQLKVWYEANSELENEAANKQEALIEKPTKTDKQEGAEAATASGGPGGARQKARGEKVN